MTREDYFRRANEAFESGRVSEDTYNAMMDNMEIFTEEEERDERFPIGYAEVEYDDFDNAEAIDGARFDDMNFMRYMER